MQIDTIATNILFCYQQAQADVLKLKQDGIKDADLRRMVEGHYIETHWELHRYLANHCGGKLRTIGAIAGGVIWADFEGGIHLHQAHTSRWFVHMQAAHPTSEDTALAYHDGRPVYRG